MDLRWLEHNPVLHGHHRFLVSIISISCQTILSIFTFVNYGILQEFNKGLAYILSNKKGRRWFCGGLSVWWGLAEGVAGAVQILLFDVDLE